MKLRTRRQVYLFLLVSIALLILGNQGVNQYLLRQNNQAARVINLAGRQRMLSQRIAKEVYAQQRPDAGQLMADVTEWVTVHQGLQFGNPAYGLPPNRSVRAQRLLTENTPRVQAVGRAAEQYAAGTLSASALREVIGAQEGPFLRVMDETVLTFEQEAEARLQQLAWIEAALATLLLLILGLEFLYILRPAFRALDLRQRQKEELTASLREQLAEMTVLNERLSRTEHDLHQGNERLRTLNGHLNEQLGMTARQNQQLNDVQKIAQIGYWSIELRTQTIVWSEQMYDIYGLEREAEATGPPVATIGNLILATDRPDLKRAYHEVASGTVGTHQVTYRLVRPADQQPEQPVYRYLTTTIKPERSESGQITHLFGVVRDVTEEHTHKERQLLHIQRLQALVKLTAADQRAETRIRQALEFALDYLGLELALVSRVDHADYEVRYVASRGDIAAPVVGTQFDLTDTYCELTYRREDLVAIVEMGHSPYAGHPAYKHFGLETYLAAPLWVSGRKYGTLNFSSRRARGQAFDLFERDYVRLISRLIAYLIEREEHRQQLEEARERQRDLIQMVTHDLRTPLTQMHNLLMLLQFEDRPAEDKAYEKRLLEEAYQHGAKLIDQLLESYEMEYDPSLSLEVNDFTAYLRHYALTHPLAQSEWRFEYSFAPDLKVRLDPDQFQRVLNNLLDNARKFTPEGSSISLTAAREGNWVVLRVADTGIGIPADMQKNLFRRFNKRARRRGLRNEKSNGLGMTIVKQLVELHEGRIAVESDGKSGTTFLISLPALDQSSSQAVSNAARIAT